MLARIKSVQIENFRSIRNLEVDLSPLGIFVGNNDCGKSNILRALNLFFNGETNPGKRFDFSEDYNFFAPVRNRRAKEIVIKIEVELPEGYRRTNGDVVIWKKTWRETGQWSDDYDYHGERITTGRRGREVRETVEIPDRSNVHSLLRKIDFEYVPAIKDTKYFAGLRGRIYGIISDVAARTFHESSAAFESSIGDHLNDLTSSISDTLKFDTRLALPRDLSHIFERLDFQSGEKAISLDNRGDGIKARHIPLILRFMAEKKAELQTRGASPISSIWAYEEPENNLEIASAVQLADELRNLRDLGTAQILLTTHSPVFYDLAQKDDAIALNFVTRPSDEKGTVIRKDHTGIDESLGTLSMLTSRIEVMVAEVRAKEAAKVEARLAATENNPVIFVEGESDRIVLEHALRVYFPDLIEAVTFRTKREGAGHKYVVDMLVGWRAYHKHHPDGAKAIGIVDSDAKSECVAFNKNPDNVKSAKCYCYATPPYLRGALAQGYSVPITLEMLYPLPVWQEVGQQRGLQRRSRKDVYPPQVVEQILQGDHEGEPQQDEEWATYVNFDFRSDWKIRTANYIAEQDDENCREMLVNFKQCLEDGLSFLGLL